MTSPDSVLEPSTSSSAGGSSGGGGGGNGGSGNEIGMDQSLFGNSNGLCYGVMDRSADRAQPQLATFSSPPPVFSTPCRLVKMLCKFYRLLMDEILLSGLQIRLQ